MNSNLSVTSCALRDVQYMSTEQKKNNPSLPAQVKSKNTFTAVRILLFKLYLYIEAVYRSCLTSIISLFNFYGICRQKYVFGLLGIRVLSWP